MTLKVDTIIQWEPYGQNIVQTPQKNFSTCQILNWKFYNASDFEPWFSQRVRFAIKFFYRTADFWMKTLQRVIFSNKISILVSSSFYLIRKLYPRVFYERLLQCTPIYKLALGTHSQRRHVMWWGREPTCSGIVIGSLEWRIRRLCTFVLCEGKNLQYTKLRCGIGCYGSFTIRSSYWSTATSFSKSSRKRIKESNASKNNINIAPVNNRNQTAKTNSYT